MSNIILSHVSPISPRGVMSVSAFEGKNQHKTPLPPLTANKESSKENVLPEETPAQKQQQPAFFGSVAYHGRFTIRPSERNMALMVRGLLANGPNAASTLARFSRAVLEDAVMHQMGFQRSGEDIYIGYMQGHRVALARLDNHTGDFYGLACSDPDMADRFLLLLRSFDLEVVDETGMRD